MVRGGDRRPRVLVVGDIVTDILAVYSGLVAVGSDTTADISITGGGSAANTAAWLASLGCPVGLVGMAGTDRAGDERLTELTAAGVDCAAVRQTPNAPTGSVIVLANSAERSMFCDRGANLLLSPSDVDAALASAGGHVHVSGYTLLDDRVAPGRTARARHRTCIRHDHERGRGLGRAAAAGDRSRLSRLGTRAPTSCSPTSKRRLRCCDQTPTRTGRAGPPMSARSVRWNSPARWPGRCETPS